MSNAATILPEFVGGARFPVFRTNATTCNQLDPWSARVEPWLAPFVDNEYIWRCHRAQGHSGRHAAGDDDGIEVVFVWGDPDE